MVSELSIIAGHTHMEIIDSLCMVPIER